MTKFNVGDKVRYIGGHKEFNSNVTSGKVYVINSIDNDGDALFHGDNGSKGRNYISSRTRHLFEIVTEPTVEASPSVIDLLTNLALRLTKVEDALMSTDDNETPTQAESVDNVNSPQHYRHGRFETIELIEDITKKYDDGFVAYCVGNAVKYVDRAPFKHGSPVTDIKKAAWYLTKAADYMDAK